MPHVASEVDVARYYQSRFPAKELAELFKHGSGVREWAVENPYRETYVRYLSAATGAELHALLKRYGPGKLHCGPRYNVDFSDRRQSRREMVAVESELRFDVDLSDYGFNADAEEDCARAWPLIVLALECIGIVLEEHFGFEHIIYTHSGRRGGHVWVMDAAARELTNEERAAIVSWCTPHGQTMEGGRRYFQWAEDHPNFRQLCRMTEQCFLLHCLPAQDEGGIGMLDDPDDRAQFVSMIVPEQDRLHREWTDVVRVHASGAEAYLYLKHTIQRLGPRRAALLARLRDAILSRVWMKLDENVSKTRNHLLKVFFSVHPKTGRVSLPIPKSSLKTFDPRSLPTVGALYDEDPAAVLAMNAAVRHIVAFSRTLDEAERLVTGRKRRHPDAEDLSTCAQKRAARARESSSNSSPEPAPASVDLTTPQLGARLCNWTPRTGCDRVVLVLRRRLRAYAHPHERGANVRLLLDQMPADLHAPLRRVPRHEYLPFPPDDALPWSVHERNIEIALRAAARAPGSVFVAAEKTTFVALPGCTTIAEGMVRYNEMRAHILRRCMTLFNVPTAELEEWGRGVARIKCEVLLSDEVSEQTTRCTQRGA